MAKTLKEPMRPIHVRLSDYDKIKALSEERSIPMVDVVTEFLRSNEKSKPKKMGKP
jgi:hypothetical protein